MEQPIFYVHKVTLTYRLNGIKQEIKVIYHNNEVSAIEDFEYFKVIALQERRILITDNCQDRWLASIAHHKIETNGIEALSTDVINGTSMYYSPYIKNDL